MEDIIIGGVSLEVLKQQQAAIRKDASKVIAEHIEKGKALLEQLLQGPDEDSAEVVDYEALASEAYDHLQVVELVAGISGVTFMLPYYEEYGRYDYSDIFSSRLENSEHIDAYEGAVGKLRGLLESMESDSCAWHSSMC